MTALTSVLSRACFHLLFTFYNIKLVFILILSQRVLASSVGLYNRELYVVRASVIPEGNLKQVFETQTGRKKSVLKNCPTQVINGNTEKGIRSKEKRFRCCSHFARGNLCFTHVLTEDLPLGGQPRKCDVSFTN